MKNFTKLLVSQYGQLLLNLSLSRNLPNGDASLENTNLTVASSFLSSRSKPRAWTDSPNSQTITDMISSSHFQLASGQTSDQNFISGNLYCIKSCALKFQRESLGIFFDTVVIHEDISGKQPLGRNLPKSDATVKITCLDGEGRFIPLHRSCKAD